MKKWQDYRNYEVSVWTLQDNYITTLKSGDPIFVGNEDSKPAVAWPQARMQGQIQNAIMELNIDGTQTLSFDIPMYLFINGERIENPNWYNNVNNNTLVSMRKIKVIFNREQDMNYLDSIDLDLQRKQFAVNRTKNTFEFIIMKVSESHELDNLMCHVECEGLAFHELGKVGFKKSLSAEEFYNEYYEWSKQNKSSDNNGAQVVSNNNNGTTAVSSAEPKCNIQYWLQKAGIEALPNRDLQGYIDNSQKINPNKWYYEIRMAHTSLMDPTGSTEKLSNVIYEEGFITDWTDSGLPVNYQEARERQRIVDINESNLYNITQDLAETFQVFCRYEYLYNTNYNITGRIIVFYNNFLQEEEDVQTLMYPNSASKISREMDSSNISTKMFVRSVTNDSVYEGQTTIMDCGANKSKEDYLLNFNYLHDIGTITDQQYKEIKPFELQMRKYNNKLIPMLSSKNVLETLKTNVDAKVTSLTKQIELDRERITENEALIYALDIADGEADGYITRDYRNPEVLTLLKDSSNAQYDTYYVQLNSNDKCRGVDPSSLKLYKDYTQTSTVTYQYNIGFIPYSSNLKNKSTVKIPDNSFSNTWLDYALEYKGTIGCKAENCVNALPKDNINDGDSYQALNEDYPSPYKINREQWFVYSAANKTWTISDSAGTTNKGLIGKPCDLSNLPDSSKVKKGWVYYVITDTEINGQTRKQGTLCIYNGSSWSFKEHPAYEYRAAKNKEITQENIKNLYEKSGNDTYFRTKRAHVHDSATYYVRKINYERTGFYIYKCTTLLQKNGLTSKTYTAERKEAQDGYTRDYVKKARLIYYVRGSGGDAPGQPTIASADTEETIIKSINTINEWSSYLSSPDSEVLSDYLLYKVWEISYNTGRRGFTELKKINQEYQGETYSSASDASGTAISTGLSQAAGQFLKDEDEISNGIFKYDEYHNLDKVTGLFKSDKKGSYYWYGIASTNNVTEDINTLISDTWNAVNEIEFPSTEERKSKYVLIKEQTYYGNGNSAMRYTYKYYDDKDTCVVPENPGTHIQIIEPIFYLNTKSSASSPSTTIDVEKVISSAETDVWTTMFVSATKASQKYYLGWKVTTYDNNSKCYYNRQANDDEFKIKQTKVKDTDTDDIPKYIYAIFRYKPDLYYEKIKESWMNKLQKDISLLEKNQNRQRSLTNAIESLTVKIKKIKSDKENEIAKFEYMMGAALRESYWQPEDEYQDFGSRYEEQFNLILQDLYHDTTDTGTFIQDTEKQQFASVGWDACLFDNEQESFYEYGIEQKKIYYPCIDLTQLGSGSDNFLYKYQNDREKHLYSVFYNPTNVMISDSGEQYDIRYSQYFSINSEVQFAFLRDSNGRVKPILIVLGAETLSDDMLKRLKTTGKLGKLTIDFGEVTNDSNPKAAKLVVDTDSQYDLSNAWIEKSELKKSEIVYPRIIVPSLKLKTSSNNLVLHYTKTDDNAVIDKVLENYEDYYIFTQTYYDDTPEEEKNRQYKDPNNKIFAKYKYRNLEKVNINELVKKEEKLLTYYTITIKPEYLFNNVDLSDFVLSVSSQNKMEFGSFKLFYCLSNADLSIYLDAKEILKENAYPKVSYSIEISRWSPDLLRDLHNKLAQIVMINDTDLKLQNTFGYVSGVKLDLDHEEKDTVEIKNYKTKFEDLFSKIVAETEAMHKSGYNIGLAGALGAGGGGLSVPLNPEGFEATLEDPSIQEQLQEFLQTYFDGPEVVQLQLQDMWDEAGQILASAATSLNSAMSATTKNASILAGFRENVTAALTPKVFTGKEQPTDFKPGDIWMNEEDGYFAVATGYSGRNGGFTRTHDGSLAEIKGANVQFDAETGIVDITGETQINLMSGKSIYIAANDNVDIIGNKSVNIGGVTINLASANIIGDGYSGIEGGGGIHLVSTDYYYSSESSDKPTGIEDDGYLIEGGASRVDISGSGIEMASKNGIVIKSGAGIDIKSSDNENVSAIAIDKDKGIYLGATKGLTLYAGDAANYYYGPEVPSVIYEGDYWVQTDWVQAYDDTNDKNHVYPIKKRNNTNYYTNLDEENRSLPQDKNYYYANYGSLVETMHCKKAVRPPESEEIVWQEISQAEIDLQGATVLLTRDSLLLGMSNIGASSATAISMDIDQIVLAAGKDLGQIKLSDGTVTDFSKADLSGLQIQSNYIGMATGNGENQNRSLFSMRPEKILLGTISNSSEFISITQNKWDNLEFKDKDQNKKYLIIRDDGYYDKKEYKLNFGWITTAEKTGPEQFTGSYLWLGKEEIYIGSMGHFTLNTNNIKIQSKNLSEKKGVSSDSSDYVIGMGFALGNRLQTTYVPPQPGESDNAKAAREAANPDIGLGFWIDGSGGKHLLVDANEIKLGGDPVASLQTILDEVPYETQILYKLHNYKDSSHKPFAPIGITWGTLSTTEYNLDNNGPFIADGWSQNLPSPANTEDSETNKYVWRITQYKYKKNSASKYTVLALTPVYEGLVDKLTQRSYRVYKYFETEKIASQVLSDADTDNNGGTNGWSNGIPARPKTVNYYYGNHVCSIGTVLSSSITINDSDGNNYDARQNTSGSEITITAKETNDKIRTFTVANNSWIIRVRGMWIQTDSVAKKTKTAEWLWSRVCVDKNDGTKYYKDAQLESELADLSAAGVQAYNIATGAMPVPAVSSSGLTVSGDMVLLGSTGKLALLGNSEVFIGSTSSNSAMVLNKNGISIGTGADIGICAGGKIEMYAGAGKTDTTGFVISPDGIDLSGKALKIDIDMKNSSNARTHRFYINTDHMSSSTNNATMLMYKGADWAHATSGWYFNIDDGLSVKGAINATSFLLNGEALSTSHISGLDTYISEHSWKLNGLSNGEREVSASDSTKIPTVELTSTYGLVLGANYGVFIPKTGTSKLDDTYMSITKNGIKFDYNASTHIYLDSNGIDVTGKRISINGDPVWARDDIIILSQNPPSDETWRKTVKGIENHMKVGKTGAVHDWVLIKPYYNSAWDSDQATFDDRGRRIPTAEGGNPVTFLNQIACADENAFGTLLEPNGYHYTANIELLGIDKDKDSAGPTSVTVVIKNDTLNLSVTITIPVNGVTLHYNTTTAFSSSIDSSVNLCREGTKISATATASSAVMLKAASIKFSCNSVSSRVPCTVYYYP